MISRTEAGKEMQTGLSDYYQNGDYIVAKYSELGSKQGKGKLYGDKAAVLSLAQKIAKHALNEAEGNLATVEVQASKPTAKPKPVKKKASKADKIVQAPTLKVDGFANDVEEGDTKLDITEIIKSSGGSPVKQSDVESHQTLSVVFSNKLGKIKVKVIGILKTDSSIALVFKDENDLTFEPQQGEMLNLIMPDGETIEVLYTGFLYTWIDNQKKVMILMINPN